MKTTRIVPFLVIACFLLFSFARLQANESTDAAVAAAEKWLGLVDARQYGKSWQESAPIFQSSVTKGQWEQAVGSVRNQMGALKERSIHAADFQTTLPGAPDGEYVVVQFKTRFANKAEAIETVTPMKVGGVWKVSGYFVR
jgi:hypothetical protein